jgi:Fe-S cluster biogenesis protein NfuA
VDVARLKINLMTAEELIVNVEKALEEIRPFLVTDGGDISLVNIENNIVRVQLEGACISCSVNQMTLTNGVEATIKRYAPQIEKVIEVSQELTK